MTYDFAIFLIVLKRIVKTRFYIENFQINHQNRFYDLIISLAKPHYPINEIHLILIQFCPTFLFTLFWLLPNCNIDVNIFYALKYIFVLLDIVLYDISNMHYQMCICYQKLD